ncbi:MAG TPA: SelB C-terminal domain-containing protein, partial [Vicinamibacterales bacterium]|nr:SelB C-terminal domain-containing protein [Vicinamibacterales bacterium]
KHGARVRFHQGTAEILGRVALIGPASAASVPRRGEPGSAGLTLEPGMSTFARLRLEAPAVLTRGDRFILRAYSPSVTIGGGLILDPSPPRTAIRTAAALQRCQRLVFDPASSDRTDAELRAVGVMVDDAGPAGLALDALTWRAGIDPKQVDARANALVAAGQVIRAGDVLVSATVYARLREAVVQTLTAHHKSQPLSGGLPREELREQLFARSHPSIFDRTLDDLAKTVPPIVILTDRVALATYRMELTPEEERVRERLERAYRDGGLKPPDAAAIAGQVGAPAPVIDRMVKLLLRQKTLVKVDTLLFHDDALKQLKAEVTALKASGGAGARIDVATFKDRFGVSRKFAIPLLEYLDRERVTRRVGESRVVL